MKIKCLAVNTATTVLSVALVEERKLIHLYETPETRDQGNLILKHIRAALDERSFKFTDIGLLAAVTGPGSFTGIRIGLAAMRGIGLATGIPVAGISSFEMFGLRDGKTANLVAVESWRDELYFTLTAPDGTTLIPPANQTPEAFAERVRDGGYDSLPLTLSGDAAAKIAPFLTGATLLPPPFPNAATAALLALESLKKGGNPPEAAPFYLREADITPPGGSKQRVNKA